MALLIIILVSYGSIRFVTSRKSIEIDILKRETNSKTASHGREDSDVNTSITIWQLL